MSNETWESEMGAEFDRRVRDLHEAPLTLDAVKGAAVSIRRRRRVAVAGAVLASAAVVTPVVAVLGNALGDAGPAPAETPTATDPTPSDPGGLGVGYLERTTYHRPGDTAFALPSAAYGTAVTLGDRVLAARDEGRDGLVVDVLDADGAVADSFPVATYPVASDAGETIAYLDPAGDLRVRWDGGEAVLAEGYDPLAVTVTAVTGGPDCDTGDCRVYLHDGENRIVVDGTGDTSDFEPDVLSLVDVSDDDRLVSVVSRLDGDYGSCGGVYDMAARAYLFDMCGYTVRGLAPDGRHVYATGPYADGFGSGFVAILDLAGNEVTRFEPVDGVVTSFAWQDDGHLLAVVHRYGARTWEVVSLDLDGATDTVAGPVRGSSEQYRFKLFG